MNFQLPSDQHVTIVAIAAMGLGLEIAGVVVKDASTQTACFTGVVSAISVLGGFLGKSFISSRAEGKEVQETMKQEIKTEIKQEEKKSEPQNAVLPGA